MSILVLGYNHSPKLDHLNHTMLRDLLATGCSLFFLEKERLECRGSSIV